MSRGWGAVVLALAIVLPAVSEAQSGAEFAKSGRLGLGLGGGTLTSGVTGKFYLTDRAALQALVGMWAGLGFSAGADAIFEQPPIYEHEKFSLNWNAGAGASIGYFNDFLFGSSSAVGISGVVGMGLQLEDYPIELTAEIRPTMMLNRYFGGFYFGSGGAVRYYFD